MSYVFFKIARVLILGLGGIALVILLFQMAEPLDAVIYANSYATGHVIHGLWSPEQGRDFFIREAVSWLWPFAMQIVGILGIIGVLLKILAIIGHSSR